MKRSRHKIVSEILNICINGASKTRIVYQANLNFRTVNPYIDILIESKLLAIKPGRIVLYETTEKGINLLKDFNHIQGELSNL
jgi:predicted transcriptional regulator